MCARVQCYPFYVCVDQRAKDGTTLPSPNSIATRILVSGASGYIGARMVELALQQGLDVRVLGTSPPTSQVTTFPWRMAEVPPAQAFDGVTAVVHLAHSWTGDQEQ